MKNKGFAVDVTTRDDNVTAELREKVRQLEMELRNTIEVRASKTE